MATINLNSEHFKDYPEETKSNLTSIYKYYNEMKNGDNSSVYTVTPSSINTMCILCKEHLSKEVTNPFVSLSCMHLVHVKCMINKNSEQGHFIDNISTQDCVECDEHINKEEMSYLYSKYFSLLRRDNEQANIHITNIEERIDSLKHELKTVLDYKAKITEGMDKAKHIITALSTLSEMDR